MKMRFQIYEKFKKKGALKLPLNSCMIKNPKKLTQPIIFEQSKIALPSSCIKPDT